MPKAVAEIEQMGAVIFRQRLAVLAEIGDVVQAGCEPIVFLLGHGAAARLFAFAKIQRERQLLLVANVLVAKQQHGIFVHAGFDVGRLLRRQGNAQIDARNLAEEMRVKLADRDRHGVLLKRRAVVPLDLRKKLLPDGAKSTFRSACRRASVMPGLAAFAKASAAEGIRGPAKPWRRRDPGIYQSS